MNQKLSGKPGAVHSFTKIVGVLVDQGKIIETPNGLWNRRVEKEIRATRQARASASERGRNAINARWNKAAGARKNVEKHDSEGPFRITEQGDYTPEKPNEINESDIRENYPGSTKLELELEIEDKSNNTAQLSNLMEAVCCAAGREFGAITQGGGRFGLGPRDAEALRRWQQDLKLTPEQIIAAVADRASRMAQPPSTLAYFTPSMCQLSADLHAPPLQPTPRQDRAHDRPTARDRQQAAAADRLQRRLDAAARIDD